MKGYIYTVGQGVDPGLGMTLTDPIFGRPPTLGACMPNIRRCVEIGDYIFVISGKAPGVPQYVVGGFRVKEKIHALAAYKRFPQYQLKRMDDDSVTGNIIVRADGTQSPLDHHDKDRKDKFKQRVKDYIVGGDPIVLKKKNEVERGRAETLGILREITHKSGSRVIDVMGRWSRLDAEEVVKVRDWMYRIKTGSRR